MSTEPTNWKALVGKRVQMRMKGRETTAKVHKVSDMVVWIKSNESTWTLPYAPSELELLEVLEDD